MSPAATADPLAGLRAYHLPGPVSWWPPAPGWWLLAGLAVLACLVALGWALGRRRRRAAARAALVELAGLRTAYARDRDPARFASELSRLLRRLALARFPRGEVAGLVGQRWLGFLDAHGGGGRFREGAGRLLADAPYRPRAEVPVDELAALARDWILCNLERRA